MTELLHNKIRELQLAKKMFYSFELVWSQNNHISCQKFVWQARELSKTTFYSFACHSAKNHLLPSFENLSANLHTLFPSNYDEVKNNIVIHLIACKLKMDDAKKIAYKLSKPCGVKNILAVRGDDDNLSIGDFRYTLDLVKFIKNEFSGEFSIGVAGYPNKHPESLTQEEDIYYLKKKIYAGANFIITQAIFDSQSFIKFVHNCRTNGISVPIIAGIMPIINYELIMTMIQKCKLNVNPNVLNDLERLKNNDVIFYEYGVKLITQIIRDIMDSGCCYGFHFFTFNQFKPINDILTQFVHDIDATRCRKKFEY